MATVTWSLWLHVHDPTNPTDRTQVVVPSVEWQDTLAGEVRSFGERRRAIVGAEQTTAVPYTTTLGSRAVWQWLHDRRGRVLVWRDPSGRVVHGATFDIATVVESAHWHMSWTVHATTPPAAAS